MAGNLATSKVAKIVWHSGQTTVRWRNLKNFIAFYYQPHQAASIDVDVSVNV
jgi:hypothetical protein